MPQMSPISWTFLFSMLILIFLVSLTTKSPSLPQHKTQQNHTTKKKHLMW